MKTKQLIITFAAFAVCLTCLFLMSGCKKSGSESSGEGLPAVTTTAVTNITDNSATCGGNVTSEGSSLVTMRGVLWAVTPNLTFETATQRTSDGSGTGTFTSTISGLTKGTTYYVRAYAVNSKGVGYGTESQFTAGSGGGGGGSYPEAPGLECVTINGIVWAPVNCGYDATNYPYGKLYQWGRKDGCGYKATDSTATYNDTGDLLQATASGPVSASNEDAAKFYTSTESYDNDWLTPKNDSRWNSGTEASPVKTSYDPCPTGWRVPTSTELNALKGGSIEEWGVIGSSGWDSSKKGYWFNGTTSPSVNSGLFLPAAGGRDFDDDGEATSRGSYGLYWSSSVDGNYARLLYSYSDDAFIYTYFRYVGIPVRCVKDASSPSVSVTTSNVTSITSTSAVCGGTVSGSVTVTARGVVWSTSQTPTLESCTGKTTDGSGTGTFTSNITGLTKGTTYYVRAYATSSDGQTAYGDQKSFKAEEGGGGGSYPEAPGLECITINGIVWAPVNCGYDATNYPYGKLYQWGRKDGCGYGATWSESGTTKGPETVIQTIASGPVSASSEDAYKFYTSSNTYNLDWLFPQNNLRWNSGKEASPVKTQYDPCPTGWRVPTYTELNALIGNSGSSSIGTAGWDSAKKGYWVNGTKTPKSGEGLFLPAAGYNSGNAQCRGSRGDYWSSSSIGTEARILTIGIGFATMFHDFRSYGYSVRCVQE